MSTIKMRKITATVILFTIFLSCKDSNEEKEKCLGTSHLLTSTLRNDNYFDQKINLCPNDSLVSKYTKEDEIKNDFKVIYFYDDKKVYLFDLKGVETIESSKKFNLFLAITLSFKKDSYRKYVTSWGYEYKDINQIKFILKPDYKGAELFKKILTDEAKKNSTFIADITKDN